MAGALWTPEAERLTPVGTPGTMSGVGGPRATLHCTVSDPGSFDAMHRTLRIKAAEPHYLYDPANDRLGQYFPLDRSARALKGSPDVSPSHNKAGKVNIQVEVCAQPKDWTKGWTPGRRFRAMMRDIASWGVKPEFVARLPRNADDRDNVDQPASVVYGNAGGGLWWGHCHYKKPEIHWDPGPINEARFFAGYPNQEDDVTPQDKKDIAKLVWDEIIGFGIDGEIPRSAGWALGAVLRDGQRQSAQIAAIKAVDPVALATAVAAALPQASVSVDDLAKAIVTELVDRTTDTEEKAP